MQPRPPSENFLDLALRLRRDEDVSLEEVATTLDVDQNPGTDPDLSRALLDGLAERAGSRLCSLRDPGGRVLTLVDFLHREERFHGNTEAYDDPGNSYLHQVLERRTGIPITLCIVTIEIGRRLGIPIHGSASRSTASLSPATSSPGPPATSI
ncbi:MAG: hypothetical protein GY937_13730 [bacterium]|nr:hypothetical protein [bacterium]